MRGTASVQSYIMPSLAVKAPHSMHLNVQGFICAAWQGGCCHPLTMQAQPFCCS